MEVLLQDVRFGLRNLARNPGFTIMAVVTLMLGIGANTTIFSVINSTLLRPLVPDPDRLVLVWQTFGKDPKNINIVSAPNFWDFKRESRSFSSMAIFDSAGRGYNLSSTGGKQDAEQVLGLRVSAEFFNVLGIKPMLGRTFLTEEETLGRDREVVLSYGLWKGRYGGDPSLLGHTIRVDGDDFTVVGVMPPGFEWQFWSNPRQLWVPVGYTKTYFGRGNQSFLAIGRLKPGITEAQARSEMAAIGSHLRKQYPDDDANMSGTVTPLADFDMQHIRTVMFALLAAVAFVLLIACVNVANLLLARGAARQKEFAIRRAIGAAGWRISQQLLTESVLLSIAGGIAGVLFASWGSQVMLHVFKLNSLDLPMRPIDSIPMDGRVFAFAFIISLATGLLFGIAPALSVLRGNFNEALKEGGRTGATSAKNRLRHALVATEVALALVILCGAGLMIRSMSRLMGVDPGLNAHDVVAMTMSVPQEAIYVGPPGLPRFCQDMEEHVGAVPGVLSVGAVGHLPFEGNAGRSFQIEGRPAADPANMPGASYSVACPNYFRTMGIPIIRGREFTAQDTLSSPGVIVINEAMARRFWPKEDPVGKAIRFGRSDGPRLTIAGIYGDVHYQGLDVPVNPQFMRPYPQAGWPIMNPVVRTANAPALFVSSIKKAMLDAFPDRPVSNIQMMETVVHDSSSSRRFPMLLLSAFAVLAMALAAIGIVGVVGNTVVQRTQEIGIRRALGAQTFDVLRLMVSGSMAWVFIGLVIGAAGSVGLTRLMTGLLYDVRPFDPLVIGAVSLMLAVVALLASYLPARAATKIEPVIALRFE